MKKILVATICMLLAGCAGRQVTTVQPLSESADAPYANVLVVSLFNSFDRRRILERAIVKELGERGIRAVASTSRMNTRTPLNRDTFVAMVDELGSDAVLVTQLVDVETEGKVKTRRPDATYNFGPTRYYNVWTVELTEYREPPTIATKSAVVLASRVYSAETKEPVWAIESKLTVRKDLDDPMDYSLITDEAKSIVGRLARDGLLAQ